MIVSSWWTVPCAGQERLYKTTVAIWRKGSDASEESGEGVLVQVADGLPSNNLRTKVGARVMATRRLRVFGDYGYYTDIVNGDLGTVIDIKLDSPDRRLGPVTNGSSLWYPVVKFDSGMQSPVARGMNQFTMKES